MEKPRLGSDIISSRSIREKNTWHWDWGAAIFPEDKVKAKTLEVDDIGKLEENITKAKEVKEMRD